MRRHRSALGVEDAALDHRADAAAEIEHRGAGAAQGGDLVGVVGGAGHGPAGGAVGEALDDEAAQGAGQLGQPLSSIVPRSEPFAPQARRRRARRAPRPRRAAARPCAARCARRRDGSRPGPGRAGGGRGCARSRPRRWSGRRATRAALFAVGGRLLAGEVEQRAHQAAVARAHPQQGAAAGRRGKPVEDRLDLIVGGVAGGDQRPVRQRQLRRRRVAGVACPGLAGCRDPRAGAAARSRAPRRAARRGARSAPRPASESSRKP